VRSTEVSVPPDEAGAAFNVFSDVKSVVLSSYNNKIQFNDLEAL